MENCNRLKYFFLIVLIISLTSNVYLEFTLRNRVNLSLLLNRNSRQDGSNTTMRKLHNKHTEGNVECNIPKLDPFSPKVLRYVKKPKSPIRCDLHPNYPPLFNTDFDNNLIRFQNPENFGFKNCCYKHFHRFKGSDSKVWLSPECIPIQKNVTKIPAVFEYIAVYCRKANATLSINGTNKILSKREGIDSGSSLPPNDKMVDIFGFVSLKREVEDRIQNITRSRSRDSKTKEKLSVIILGLDSISNMHFIRSMPKTFHYLTKTLHAVGMNGFVKVGENTFPNIIPVLTGMTVKELKQFCWPSRRKYLDNCPFIWKDFSAQGYRTSFGEDNPGIAAFNYQKKGFNSPPTDYYLRPMVRLHRHNVAHHRTPNTYACAGPRLSMKTQLDNIEKMAWTMGEAKIGTQKMDGANNTKIRPYFQWIWNNLSHDYLSYAFHGDDFVFSTLKFLNDNGFLNHTVFILMSDHGFRMGSIRKTFQGQIEARMPLLYFVLPKWFRTKYSEAFKNLKKNANRLTTPFDLYPTLKDFLRMDEKISNKQILARTGKLELNSRNSSRGISLFLPIPLSRKCGQAGISAHWCVCKTVLPILTNDWHVVEAGQSFVRLINRQLKKNLKCSILNLKNIVSAQSVRMNESDFDVYNRTITLILETIPGNAVFESTMSQNALGQWVISSDSRINRYGNQSHCVQNEDMKRYCFCKDTAIKSMNNTIDLA